MEFKSQICTTIEQSERLLKLGLKPKTADMYHTTFYRDNVGYEIILVRNEKLPLLSQEFPAWSLHRLMEIGNLVNVAFLDINKAYKVCIDNIEEQIRLGIINKEYLNKK